MAWQSDQKLWIVVFRRTDASRSLAAKFKKRIKRITKLRKLDLTVAFFSEQIRAFYAGAVTTKKERLGLGLAPEWNEELR
jgi:hypothetical protein